MNKEYHDNYVAEGYCPYVSSKVWCNDRAGHEGSHWAKHIKPNGKVEIVFIGKNEEV